MEEIKFRGKQIRYYSKGKGPVVLLIHGFGENGKVWNRQVEALHTQFRLIVPDLPGSGQSGMSEGDVSLDTCCEAMIAIMEKESPTENFHCFGHSMGGYITMAVVEKYANRLKSFGLIHSSSYSDTKEKIEIRKKAIRFIKENGGEAIMKTIVPNMFSEQSKTTHPEWIKELSELAATVSDTALIQYYNAMIQRPDRSAILASTSLPVLFMIGGHDNAIPFDLSIKQCHIPSISSVHILENSGHMGMWEYEKETNSAMASFLNNFS